jgi:Ca2+-binding EF-hand superfamily protein
MGCGMFGPERTGQGKIGKSRKGTMKLTDNSVVGFSEIELRREVNRIFDEYDLNHDDYLEFEEVKQMFMAIAARKQQTVSSEQAAEMANAFLARTDISGNGRVDRAEFYQYYKNR